MPDLLAQLLAGSGSHWLCLLNSALYTFSVPVLASIIRALEIPKPGWLIWAYAFAPFGWVVRSGVMVEYGLSLYHRPPGSAEHDKIRFAYCKDNRRHLRTSS